jgi:hypothetical protein
MRRGLKNRVFREKICNNAQNRTGRGGKREEARVHCALVKGNYLQTFFGAAAA